MPGSEINIVTERFVPSGERTARGSFLREIDPMRHLWPDLMIPLFAMRNDECGDGQALMQGREHANGPRRGCHCFPGGLQRNAAGGRSVLGRTRDPAAKPMYVMIEFDPVSIGGNTLRGHWVASFERHGRRYFFADSKRLGHLAGPYASTQEFIAEYAQYRGRRIVSFREVESYERKARTPAVRQSRAARP